jgi:DNA (cytosine-5)-methyltransferase 1
VVNVELTHVDLFCGGGGTSRGFHNAGFKSIFAADQEWFCVESYNANFGNVAELCDVANLHGLKILNKIKSEPLVVTASPPCEPYTSANEHRIKDPYFRMFDDPVGRLMIDAIRLISDLNPKYYMMENVMGILEGDNKKLLTEEFDRLGLDKPHFNVLQAAEWGVPSYRNRVVISNIKLESPKLPKITVMESIKDLASPNYPHDINYHEPDLIPDKYLTKAPLVPAGEGLIYFKGSKQQHKNYMRLYPDKPGEVVMGLSKFLHPFEDRLLTPREHARLMTFPDNHIFIGTKEQIYDMIGEAVPPNLAYGIAKQIIEDYNTEK